MKAEKARLAGLRNRQGTWVSGKHKAVGGGTVEDEVRGWQGGGEGEQITCDHVRHC